LGSAGGTPELTNWAQIQGTDYNVTGHMSIQADDDPNNLFRFLMHDKDSSNDVTWSSRQGDNSDGLDHMVTFYIDTDTAPDEGGNSTGNFFVFWEDLPGSYDPLHGIDRDFNDVVLEVERVAPVPEPSTIALLALGASAVGLGVFRRRRG